MSEEPPPLYRAISTIGLLVLTFVVGALVADSQMWPYEPLLKRGFQALRTTVSEHVRLGVHDVGDIWQLARNDSPGVSHHDAAKSAGGYTLYSSGHGTEATLVDMDGKTVHKWDVPLDKAYPELEHVSDPIGERIVYLRRAHLFSNGDILAAYEGYGDTPWGLGLAKFDKNSNLIWAYPERVHHDFEVAADGSITTLIHRMRELAVEPLELDAALEPRFVEDSIVRLDADGNETSRINLVETLARSPYGSIIGHKAFPEFEGWDPTHANDVSVIGPGFAAHHAFATAGQVMISFRTLDLIALLDMETKQFVWASRGLWVHQHDPDPLEDGSLLVFDNFGNNGGYGQSRVVRIDPSTGAELWSFAGTESLPFESLTRSCQQPLSNGNLMIVESDGARILEVTQEKEVVWEFHSPHRREEGQRVAIIADAHRVPMSYPTFLP